PPVGYIGNGPSGVTIHPGVAAIPDRYKEHFFMCDFKGSSGQSGIHAFKLKPKGASFQFDAMPERFAWSVLATDCDFGPDGGFYISDWVDGWGLTGKGRIYKIADPKMAKEPAVLEVKKLLAEGMSKRTNAELLKLLEHADMRVRQEAQFALVEHKAQTELMTAATKLQGVARLHGIWGLGMLHHYGTNAAFGDEGHPIVALLSDKDVQVRCQALKFLGEFTNPQAIDAIVRQLKADHPQVRMQAALTIGKFNKLDAIPAVAEMLRDNADKDPYLRHAGVMAFTSFGDKNRDSLINISKDASPSVRLAALLAMRRLGMTEITQFLSDADPRLVLEAARAINDELIDKCLPELAALSTRKGLSDPLLYRVINANFRLKTKASAVALAKLAGRADVSETMRVEALDCLLKWDQAQTRDRIVGLYRPVAAKPAADVADAVKEHIGGIMVGPNKVRTEGAKVAAKFGVKEVGPALLEIAADVKRSADVRVESLKALATLNDKELEKAMKLALVDGDPRVRTQGRHLLNKLKPGEIVEELKKALDNGDTIDRQGAFAILADLKQPEATALLVSWLDKLVAKKVPADIQLDLLEAAEKNKAYALTGLLSQYEAQRSKTDPLAKWSESLEGGDAEIGKKIFFERSELSCVRCHKVQGNGGEVGPDLTGIGAKQKRDYLLESIVLPDKTIAQGFETVVLTLTDGKTKTGILKSEDKKEVRLMTAEGQLIVVPVAEIDTRSRGPSAMPADLIRQLTRRELRDLVEYLAGLR
ncbi:MAG TPA: HEAT repeat domain-containing protein, partial [Gemmataceae bacterium]|nr:HEAT repeat domain-containing protein [Gemmataceae bacterium]